MVQYCYQGETKGSVREKGESGKESQGRKEERREVIVQYVLFTEKTLAKF